MAALQKSQEYPKAAPRVCASPSLIAMVRFVWAKPPYSWPEPNLCRCREKDFYQVPHVEDIKECYPNSWGQTLQCGDGKVFPCSLRSVKINKDVAKKEGGPHEA